MIKPTSFEGQIWGGGKGENGREDADQSVSPRACRRIPCWGGTFRGGLPIPQNRNLSRSGRKAKPAIEIKSPVAGPYRGARERDGLGWVLGCFLWGVGLIGCLFWVCSGWIFLWGISRF